MAESQSLSSLVVIDRLEVGPVETAPGTVKAPYTVQIGSMRDTVELIYKYEEPVFADDFASRNLAALLTAQVAMNYGLFCREIVITGPFEPADKRFLEEVLENTSREIYVNKILAPNPFLRPPAKGLVAEKRKNYTQATLQLGTLARNGDRDVSWQSDRSRHAVLLSGGKDSLLTHALLTEMGAETHPIFINESGRHWYTALNAYRHFEKNVPNTARVWTNADRVFSWMLRHLSFIRPDFANVRADIYPVRLWTVAVFLFGALPIMKARGIGRLLIGDEFDTTVRSEHEGIAHYNGLYDQSRYFDDALSRFFAKKGFGIAQFSLLRPLSELLIQRTLAERYPALQALQVSCHAAHIRGDTVYPCGKCEKCRRIVSMLVAFGLDPTACGYTEEQIAGVLEALPKHDLHQEAAGVSQLMHLLTQRGVLTKSALVGRESKPRPETLCLRFDKERAPVDLIPNDLRRPFYTILSEHADGAVIREGRRWVPFDALSDSSLTMPYRFEGAPQGGTEQATTAVSGRYRLGELTWREAKEKLRTVDIALFPVGSIEQHGPHLPLDVDAYDAERLCADVAKMCSDPKPFVLPLMPYGVSYHHDEFPGTVSVSPATLAQLTVDVGMSVAKQGITKLIIVNGHGGNGPSLHFAAQMINRDAHIFTCVETGESSDSEIAAFTETRNDVHAGEVETSTTLALRPELVQMDLARRSVPRFSSDYLEFSSKKSIEWYVRTGRISKTGVLGDPTKADPEKGKLMWEIMVRNLARFVEDLKGLTLDEIYQKRY